MDAAEIDSRGYDTEMARAKTVHISMFIDSYVLIFGVPLMLTAIILGTLIVGHFALPQPVVQVAAPAVSVAAPQVTAQIKMPEAAPVPVTVNVPRQDAPVVNVTAPLGDAPRITVNVPDGKPGELRTVEKVVERTVDRPVYVWVDTREKAHVTFQDIIASAEKYLQRGAKDFVLEQKRWLDAWQARVQARGGDEQALFGETLIEKRGGFDTAKAQPGEVTEVCRLILRVRDAGLSVPEVFREKLTAASLGSFKAFLDK